MDLSSLKPPEGATKTRKRLGRGKYSSQGKTSGKGHKGQKSRSGAKIRPGFEGGQMPLQRRLPKRGFKNYLFKKEFALVQLGALGEKFEAGAEVDPEKMKEAGLVKKFKDGVKVLAVGDLSVALKVKAHKFSKAAEEKIVQAGGSVEKLL